MKSVFFLDKIGLKAGNRRRNFLHDTFFVGLRSSKQIYLLFTLCFLFPVNVFSQDNEKQNINALIDSIENQHTVAKTTVYMNLVRKLLSKNPNKAVGLCNKWINKAKRLKNTTAEIDALTTLSKINIMLGNYEKADSITQEAIIICKEQNYKDPLAAQYGNLGVSAEMIGQNTKAVEYYLKADSIFTITKNLKNKAFIQNNLGIVFSNMKIFDKSLHYYKSALKNKAKLQDSLGMASTLTNIGVLYEKMEADNDSILQYYISAKEIYDKYQISNSKAIVYANIGQIKIRKNEYVEASQYLEQALQMRTKLKDKYGIASTKLSLALLKSKQKKYRDAIKYAKEGSDFFTSANVQSKLLETYNILSDAYEKDNQKDSAIIYLKLFIQVNDSMLSQTNRKTVQELEAKYQNTVNLKKITILKQQNEINQLMIYILAIFVIAVIIISVFIMRQRRLQQSHKQLITEQKLLRTQLNPHFIFNSIGSIQNYMFKNDAKQASGYLANFSALMRAILQQSTQEFITLDDDIKILENYLSLEKMRAGNLFTYKINVDENIDTEEIMLPPMLTQPFVENAVKHAFKNRTKPEDNIIEISFTVLETFLLIKITDNGVGINYNSQQNTQHKSMSSDIFRQRMELLGKKWSKSSSFSIKDLSKEGLHGTDISIRIPVN